MSSWPPASLYAAPEDSPAVRHPETAQFDEERRACRALFLGTRAIHDDLAVYLPRHEAERPSDHFSRGRFTEVYNGFGRTVSAITALVFQRPPVLGADVPREIRQHYESLDVAGTHGDVFFRHAFQDALIVGYGGFLVEYPRRPEHLRGRLLNLKEERDLKLRPAWSIVQAEDIRQWRTARVGAEDVLTLLVLTERRAVPRGAFGTALETVYRVYRHDLESGQISVEFWAERDGTDGEGRRLRVIDEETPLVGVSKIPFVGFQLGHPVGRFVARPALLDLADVNLAHYRVNADRRWLMHLCCVPTPWGRGIITPNNEGAQAIQIGPNVLVQLSENGAFGWAEPAGTAFVPTGEELQRLEQRMATLGLAFIQRDTRAAETAEARRLDTASQNSTLADAARRFEDAVEAGLMLHAEWLDLKLPRSQTEGGGSFTLNRDFESTVVSEATLSLLAGMQERGQLTLDTLWSLMERGQLLPAGFDAEREKLQLSLERDAA